MPLGLLGKKIGMTRIYTEAGDAIPVTVVEVRGNTVVQVKTADKDGYDAAQVGFDDQKPQRVNRPASITVLILQLIRTGWRRAITRMTCL